MKKINPKDLVKGKKYLVELEFNRDIIEGPYPLQFTDTRGGGNCLPLTQPIYTLDDQPQHPDQPQKPDPELEMLVNVASRLYVTGEFGNHNSCARDAAELIAACKKIKEGER